MLHGLIKITCLATSESFCSCRGTSWK